MRPTGPEVLLARNVQTGRQSRSPLPKLQYNRKYKPDQRATAGKMYHSPVEEPNTVVAVDLVGPLPRSSNGHTWILVCQDTFSKWIIARPLRQATATVVARAIEEYVILQHGCPKRIITDNGRQFESREFRDLMARAGIEHRKNAAVFAPVERANR